MKKPEFLKKANWIDLLVIIGIALVVIMGVYHVSPYSEETESEAYDVATIDKVTPKYLDFYNRGEVVKTHIAGTNVSNGNTVVLDGVITWSDENPNDKYIQMLVNGEKGKVLIGSYKSTPNADVYINQMTMSIDGQQYSNVTEVKLAPIAIESFNDLCKGIDKYDNIEITTTISCQEADSLSFQRMYNEFLKTTKRTSVKYSYQDQAITVTKAKIEDLKIANQNCPSINGQSDYITIRIYNCTNQELNDIKNNYNVIHTKKIT